MEQTRNPADLALSNFRHLRNHSKWQNIIQISSCRHPNEISNTQIGAANCRESQSADYARNATVNASFAIRTCAQANWCAYVTNATLALRKANASFAAVTA